ncbi:MAG: hypothetical protein LBJ86_03610 [Spirochaetaceae bacterium]|jgi:uncharacterized protein (DUF2344 family)|nr:hypothetical protein [Spirochaetaceae bacterium]
METAVMIDGAFIRKKFRSAMKKDILASDVQQIVKRIFGEVNIADHSSYRVYFYSKHNVKKELLENVDVINDAPICQLVLS